MARTNDIPIYLFISDMRLSGRISLSRDARGREGRGAAADDFGDAGTIGASAEYRAHVGHLIIYGEALGGKSASNRARRRDVARRIDSLAAAAAENEKRAPQGFSPGSG